jgi:hypothetical protein
MVVEDTPDLNHQAATWQFPQREVPTAPGGLQATKITSISKAPADYQGYK